MPVETRKMREREKEKSKQARFRLLDLPPELQLRIYEFAICSDEPIDITIGQRTKQACISPRAQPALARTCRSIRVDALKFYYSRNIFEANYCQEVARYDQQSTAVTIAWLHSIGASNRGLISSLQLYDAALIGVDPQGLDDSEDDCLASMMERFVGATLLGASITRIQPGLHRVTFPRAQA
ncbi:hypothetical protein LTR10_006280 [Elasticomyces elasticus]|nr:hypothetical protein LTR10_006280 [Elasticomyces elasticus]KAK4966670.1 hypothetical protein LTR42_010981 [Elasticomyces elasticus]